MNEYADSISDYLASGDIERRSLMERRDILIESHKAIPLTHEQQAELFGIVIELERMGLPRLSTIEDCRALEIPDADILKIIIDHPSPDGGTE